MTTTELELHVEELEALIDEITELVEDPELPAGELRDELRDLLYDDDDGDA